MPTPDLRLAAEELCTQRAHRFVRELGRGAAKCAYLVETPTGFAALKIAALGHSPERLLREAAALQTCAHTSIATLLEAFPYRFGNIGLWVVVEEYLAGGTLQDRLLKSLLLPDEARSIGLCLADVIKHLQERRLVHRDIKPANILFRDDPLVPVLTDFGIVRMLDEPTLTRGFMGIGPGTPAYASPEQLNNEKPQIGWRTDQFGVAVVLAECLTGHHPFVPRGGTLHDAIAAVATKAHPQAWCIDELKVFGFGCLEQALQPWPISRYRRPDDFIAALRQP
ncbi:MAG: serine/threonine-protein kinase [Burkholderiaceae bacterium]